MAQATRLVNRFDTRLTGNELARQPFAFLDRVDLSSCLQVCHRWERLAEPAFWEQIRHSILPSTPRLPVVTLRERCVTRLNTIEANIRAGRFQASSPDYPRGVGRGANYYSRWQRDLFVTVRTDAIEVRDFRMREVPRNLNCAGLRPFWADHLQGGVIYKETHSFVGMAHGQLVLLVQTTEGRALCSWNLKQNKPPTIRQLIEANPNDVAAVIDDQVVYVPASQPLMIVMDLITLEEISRIPCALEGEESRSLRGQNGRAIISTFRETKVVNLQTGEVEDQARGLHRGPIVRAGGMWVSDEANSFDGGELLAVRDQLRLSQPPDRSFPFYRSVASPIYRADPLHLIPFRNTVFSCSSHEVVGHDLANGEDRRLVYYGLNNRIEQLQFHDGVLRVEVRQHHARAISDMDFNQPLPPPEPAEAPVEQIEAGVLRSFLNCLLSLWDAITTCFSDLLRSCFSCFFSR